MLWEMCYGHLKISDYARSGIYHTIWVLFYKKPSDTCPEDDRSAKKAIRRWFFESEWYEVYNFIEFLSKLVDVNLDYLNLILEQELSAYRFVDGLFVRISDDIEISAIEDALSSGPLEGVRAHMKAALIHFSQKPEPDLRNCVKEAISAVESAARVASGKHKATLGDALKAIDPSSELHPAFRDALLKLYGYTSDEQGIRHSILDNPDKITYDDAYFLLVVCSAFVNYIKARTIRLDRDVRK